MWFQFLNKYFTGKLIGFFISVRNRIIFCYQTIRKKLTLIPKSIYREAFQVLQISLNNRLNVCIIPEKRPSKQ